MLQTQQKPMHWVPLLVLLYVLVEVTLIWSFRPLIRHTFEVKNDITIMVPLGLMAFVGIVHAIKYHDDHLAKAEPSGRTDVLRSDTCH